VLCQAGRVSSAPALLCRRLTAEFLGSAFLAAVVIGAGIAAQRLSPGQTGLQLLEDAAATAAGLFAIILMFGPVSGGHFNPVVSFVGAQVVGGALAVGVIKALYPDVTPAKAADVIVPHDQARAGSASARAAHDGTSPFADRTAGPAQSH
jgi:glycerol uptake facilitator-like aquaporin